MCDAGSGADPGLIAQVALHASGHPRHLQAGPSRYNKGMKAKNIILFCAALLLLPSLYLYFMYDIRIADPVRGTTVRHCKHVAVAYQNFSEIYTNVTGIATEQGTDLDDTSRQILLALMGKHPDANPYGTAFMETPHTPTNQPTGYFGDAWGNQYLVRVDDDGDGKIEMGDRTVKARIIVWSRGPNEENDWARKDDITYKQ